MIVNIPDCDIRIVNTDCIEYMEQLDIASVGLIIADPPYYNIVSDAWDKQQSTRTEYLQWSKRWIRLVQRAMKPTASFYLFGGVGEKSDTIIRLKLLCDELGLYFKDWITWKKDRGMGTRKGWLYTREEILWYTLSNNFEWNEKYQYSDERRKRDGGKDEIRDSQNGYKAKNINKRLTDVWTDISEQTNDIMVISRNSGHPTPKPERLIERIILAHTHEGDTVLDPFLGTGTTAAVCKRLNRKCIGIEKDPNYFIFAMNRIIETQVQ
jgi:site-specific DNA-methyltransferase (adenine-specific)